MQQRESHGEASVPRPEVEEVNNMIQDEYTQPQPATGQSQSTLNRTSPATAETITCYAHLTDRVYTKRDQKYSIVRSSQLSYARQANEHVLRTRTPEGVTHTCA